jgi:hypothetical protein
MSYCKKCTKILANFDRDSVNKRRQKKRKSIRANNDFHSYISEKIYSYKRRASKLGVPFDLTKDDLIKKYDNQFGKCYYTGVDLILSDSGHNEANISLDRKIPDKGYVLNNVVWCSYLTNSMKRDLPLDRFYFILETILSKHIV